MQAGMAAYPPPVGGVPGGVAGFAPGMMPSYPLQGAGPTPMAQAAPRGPLFPSASAPAGSNSQPPRQVREGERARLFEGGILIQ